MKISFIFLILFFQITLLNAQRSNYDLYRSCKDNYSSEVGLRVFDSLYLLQLPPLPFPEKNKNVMLPVMVDNSKFPFLRPVIHQGEIPFCEQVASIGYAFTYEMAYSRNVPADTSINQYPLSFVYNFESSGLYGGVSFFYSLEILKKCGSMNVSDYGGLSDDGTRWITGYDKYYNGMHNRLEDVYTIKTSSKEGIQTLKHWIYNHLDESNIGGVAIFQAGSPWNFQFLEPGTPEQGRPVMTSFNYPATHTMTIVGYNDNIRYDYNHDGKYTNDIDLNFDGVIDVRDWEKGAFRFVNSYGDKWPTEADSGFCYMMYRTLAESYDNGGIWNNCVQVLKVKADYSPLLTMKVRLKDNLRSSLRLKAGVSTNPLSYIPDQIIEFPIFNFQGSNYPMQGEGISDTMQTIEFGFDITPLLSYTQANCQSVFFHVVDENDPLSIATGHIESMSVIDYSTSPPQHYYCIQTPIILNNNLSTYARTLALYSNNKVQIGNPTIQAFTPAKPYSIQLSATGGKPPYTWSIQHKYSRLQQNNPTPFFSGTKIIAEKPSDSTVAIPLGFSFPFYGQKYDTVFVNLNNGYLQFTNDKIPWPYLTREKPLLENFKLIIPLTNKYLNKNNAEEGVWSQINPSEAIFKWKLSKIESNTLIPYEFQVRLSPDGTISFWHDNISINNYEFFYSGISNGDNSNSQINEYTNDANANLFNTSIYTPNRTPDSLTIDQQGLIKCTPASAEYIYKIPIQVIDYNHVSDYKEFDIASGIHIDIRLNSGVDSILSEGEIANADLILTNLTANLYKGLTSTLSTNDHFIQISDSVEVINELDPFEEITIPSAFSFRIGNPLTDPYHILIGLELEGNSLLLKNTIPEQILSSDLKSISLQCKKSNNELIRPGETAGFVYEFINNGHAHASNVLVSIRILDPQANLVSANNQPLGDIPAGSKGKFEFDISTYDSTLLGTLIPVECILTSNNLTKLKDTLYFRIGKLPAIVVDLDPLHESAQEIFQQIKNLNYECDYSTTFPHQLYQYQSVFLNLGKFSDRYKLNYTEALAFSMYLDQGGNLYLESPNFWKNDDVTKLNSYFDILGTAKTHVYDTISGSSNSFLDGYKFYNNDFQMNTHYLLAHTRGKKILQDGTFCSAVATDGTTFKTIGSMFSIKSMQGLNDSSTRRNLVKKYIDYFSLKRNALGINETEASLKTGIVSITPNPANLSVQLSYNSDGKLPSFITIYDIQGNTIIEFTDQSSAHSLHHIEWNLCNKKGQRVPSGLYFCRILSGREVKLGKIIVN